MQQQKVAESKAAEPRIVKIEKEENPCITQDVDAIKSTIVRIRKSAKKNNEDRIITKGKISAVRKHDMEDGEVAVYYNKGDMTYYPVIIR